jgi:hypothetical protein
VAQSIIKTRTASSCNTQKFCTVGVWRIKTDTHTAQHSFPRVKALQRTQHFVTTMSTKRARTDVDKEALPMHVREENVWRYLSSGLVKDKKLTPLQKQQYRNKVHQYCQDFAALLALGTGLRLVLRPRPECYLHAETQEVLVQVDETHLLAYVLLRLFADPWMCFNSGLDAHVKKRKNICWFLEDDRYYVALSLYLIQNLLNTKYKFYVAPEFRSLHNTLPRLPDTQNASLWPTIVIV